MNRPAGALLALLCLAITACADTSGTGRNAGDGPGGAPGEPAVLSYPYFTDGERDWEDRQRIAERVARAYVKLVPVAETAPHEAGRFGEDAPRGGDGLQPGSGVILHPDGLVLTAAHVVRAEGRTVRIELRDGSTLVGRVVVADADRELALVRTPPIPGAQPLAVGRSATLEAGERALAIGSPRLAWGVVSVGTIRAANIGERLSDGRWSFDNAIEVGMLVETGHSGGPLVDGRGALIGIVAFREQGDTTVQPYRAPRIAYAVPIDDIRDWLRIRGVVLPDPD